MSPSAVTFLFEAANFLVLAGVLAWIFFRPVRAAIEARRAALDAERREAAAALAEAQRRLDAAQARGRAAEAAAPALEAAARAEAERQAAAIVEAARAAAGRERARADAELSALRRHQGELAMRDVAAAVREVLVRLLARIEGPELDLALARAAAGELHRLGPYDGDATLVIECARPLADDARALLASALGRAAADLVPRVVPELVAGVRVVTPRGLVDASAAGLAAQVEAQLHARLGDGGADG